MALRGGWRPRCCFSCCEPLETWRWPLEPDAYVACGPCARLYRVTDDALEGVVLAGEPEPFRLLLADLLAAHWAAHQPAGNAGPNARRKAA